MINNSNFRKNGVRPERQYYLVFAELDVQTVRMYTDIFECEALRDVGSV